jgi:aconitate hydratase
VGRLASGSGRLCHGAEGPRPGLGGQIVPQSDAVLVITAGDGTQRKVNVTLRIDTPIEVDYYVHGGILPYVLRQLLAA